MNFNTRQLLMVLIVSFLLSGLPLKSQDLAPCAIPTPHSANLPVQYKIKGRISTVYTARYQAINRTYYSGRLPNVQVIFVKNLRLGGHRFLFFRFGGRRLVGLVVQYDRKVTAIALDEKLTWSDFLADVILVHETTHVACDCEDDDPRFHKQLNWLLGSGVLDAVANVE